MPNKRNEHARIAQSGACNPRPIAQALVDAIGDHAEALGVHVLLALIAEAAERLDGSHYRDDVLRLLFICLYSATSPVVTWATNSGVVGEQAASSDSNGSRTRRRAKRMASPWRQGEGHPSLVRPFSHANTRRYSSQRRICLCEA